MAARRLFLLAAAAQGSAAFCATSARPASSQVANVVDSLFGAVSSRAAFARQREADEEVAERFASTRTKELTYGEFDSDFFLSLLHDARPQPQEHFVDIG